MNLLLSSLVSTAFALPSPLVPAELGLGVRNAVDALDDPGVLEGPRLVARWPLGPMALEGTLYHRLNPTEYSDLALFLLQVDHYWGSGEDSELRYSVDRWSATVLVDFGFGARPESLRVTAGPHLYAGLELARVRNLTATEVSDGLNVTEAHVQRGDATLQPAPVAGLGMDLQAFDRLTLRFAWYLRPMLEAAESGGMNLDLRPTAGLDLLCRL